MLACRKQVVLNTNPQMPLYELEDALDHFENLVRTGSKDQVRRLLGPHAGEFPALDV